jgi:hypothetical protein
MLIKMAHPSRRQVQRAAVFLVTVVQLAATAASPPCGRRMRSTSRAEDRPQDHDGEGTGRARPPPSYGPNALDRQLHVQLGLSKLTVI